MEWQRGQIGVVAFLLCRNENKGPLPKRASVLLLLLVKEIRMCLQKGCLFLALRCDGNISVLAICCPFVGLAASLGKAVCVMSLSLISFMQS